MNAQLSPEDSPASLDWLNRGKMGPFFPQGSGAAMKRTFFLENGSAHGSFGPSAVGGGGVSPHVVSAGFDGGTEVGAGLVGPDFNGGPPVSSVSAAQPEMRFGDAIFKGEDSAAGAFLSQAAVTTIHASTLPTWSGGAAFVGSVVAIIPPGRNDGVVVNVDGPLAADLPVTPEPAVYGLVGAAGLLGLIAWRRRRAR